jgi:hypothetical protein
MLAFLVLFRLSSSSFGTRAPAASNLKEASSEQDKGRARDASTWHGERSEDRRGSASVKA